MKASPFHRFGGKAIGLGSLVFVLASLGFSATTVDSRITAVTVYADRAMVTRTATLDIAVAGPLEAELSGLPMRIDDASLQASGKGTSRVLIVDVSSQIRHLDVTPNERIKALEDELRSLNQQQRILSDRENILKTQEAYLNQIRVSTTQPPAEGQARPSMDDWAKLVAFQDEALSKLAKERQGLDVEQEILQAKIQAVSRQLNELRGAQGRSIKNVVVRLNAEAPGRFELQLSYSVPGAFWTPRFDARLNSEERTITLDYQGLVRNATGEDWNDVAMTLSTARPSLGGGAPELRPWFVDVQPPPEAYLRRQKAPMAVRLGEVDKAVSTGQMMAQEAEPEVQKKDFYIGAQAAAASVDSSLSSASFKIAAPATLKADNSAQKIPIAQLKQPAVLEYRATPKLQETAYLHAKLTNVSDFPLLAGAANVFLDGSFVAVSRLATIMPGEKYELALGADEGVSIKRKLVNRFVEATGLTSKGKRTTYDILVTVKSNKRSAERIVFSEPVPISRNEKIEVKLLAPAERDIGTKEAPKEVSREEDNKLVWRLDLKAGEKRELALKFQVEHPADLATIGIE